MSEDKAADDYNEVIDKFETMPSLHLNKIDAENIELCAKVSIAISLKRIADKLELANKQPIVMSAKEYVLYKELNE